MAEKQRTKQTNYSSLSLSASLDTQDTVQGGIIVEWKKFCQETPVCGGPGTLVKQLPEPNWFPMWLLLAASSWQSLQFWPLLYHFLNEFNENSKVKSNNMLHSFYFRSTSNVFCRVKQLPEPSWFPMWLLLAASSWQSLQSSLEQSPNQLVTLEFIVKILWVGNVSMGFWKSQVIQKSQVTRLRLDKTFVSSVISKT